MSAVIRPKSEYHAITSERMNKYLRTPTWNLRQKLASDLPDTCGRRARVSAGRANHFARREARYYWMLSFGLGFDEAQASNMVLVDDD